MQKHAKNLALVAIATVPLMLGPQLALAQHDHGQHQNFYNGVRDGGQGGNYQSGNDYSHGSYRGGSNYSRGNSRDGYGNNGDYNRGYNNDRYQGHGIGTGTGAAIGGAGGAVLGAVFGGGLKGAIIGGAAGAGIGAIAGHEHQQSQKRDYYDHRDGYPR